MFGWSQITANVKPEDASYYDSLTGTLIDSESPYQVKFDVKIKLNNIEENFTLSIDVEPYHITSIRDYLLDYIYGETYYLRGIVIKSTYTDAIIQDETGTILLFQDGEMIHFH